MGYIGNSPALNESVTTAQIADDAVTLAKMATAADGAFITYDTSGNPVVITGTNGQVATSAGADAVSAFEGVPASGITTASQWRVTTSFTGDADPISANWEKVDTDGYGSLGSDMTEASGVFTFPSLGYWFITFQAGCYSNAQGADTYVEAHIVTTTNASGDSDWSTASRGRFSVPDNSYANSAFCVFVFDVTSLSDCKCRFKIDSSSITCSNSTDESRTASTFIKLGDT